MAETGSTTEGTLEQLADRARTLNERIIELSSQAGETTLKAYAKMLESIADLQEQTGTISAPDWLTRFTAAQAGLTRDLAEAYSNAASKLAK